MLIQKSLLPLWLAAIMIVLALNSVQAFELIVSKWFTQQENISVNITGSSPT